LENQIKFIHSGYGIGITPEGTRNKKGEGLLPFKKGAFHLAIQAQVPLIAFVVAPLAKVAHWESKILKRARVPIEVLPPFPTLGLTENDVGTLMNEVRVKMEEALIRLESEIVFK